MKREIQNASYRPFINNESTSLTMSVSTYFEFFASLFMRWEACVRTYLKITLRGMTLKRTIEKRKCCCNKDFYAHVENDGKTR